jgi:flagellar biosynthesis chaperone FliJ
VYHNSPTIDFVHNDCCLYFVQASLDAHPNSFFKGRHSMTGYAYNWVKKYFAQCLFGSILVIVDCNVPKPTPLSFSEGAFRPAKQEKQQQPLQQSAKKSVGRKFSLLSQQVDGSTRWGSRSQSELGSNIANEDNIFTSELLSPVFRQRFSSMWWEVEPEAAASGISNIMISKYFCRATTSVTTVPLRLKSVSIGEYFDHVEFSAINANINDVVDSNGIRKLNDKKVSKSLVTSWTQVVNVFSFSVTELGSSTIKPTSDFLSMYDCLGVFASVRLGVIASTTMSSSLSAATDNPESVQPSLLAEQLWMEKFVESPKLLEARDLFSAAVRDECRAVLPHLLTAPVSACDALILTASVYCLGPERTAEIASEIVLGLVQKAASTVFVKRYYLSMVLDAMTEAAAVLENLHARRIELTENNEMLQSVARRTSAELVRLRARVETVQFDFKKSREAESAFFLKEEVLGRTASVETLEFAANESLADVRAAITAITQTEWHSLAALFAGSKPRKGFTDIMKIVMNIINYVPFEPTKKKGKAKTEVDVISRGCITLIRSSEFATQLGCINPMSLSQSQLYAIDSLFVSFSVITDDDLVEDLPSGAIRPLSLHSLNNPVMDTIKELLFALADYRRDMDRVNEEKLKCIRLWEQRTSLVASNSRLLDSSIVQLQHQINTLSDQVQSLDLRLDEGRRKLESLEIIHDRRDDLTRLLRLYKSSVETELCQIDKILATFVGDICVAAAVFARGSWLPEELRCECRDLLRAALQPTGVKVSASVLVLGNLVDDLQIRRWANYQKESIPRCPGTLNNVCIVALNPCYSFVVDPNGIAESVLQHIVPSDMYEQIRVSASKFSLIQFELWCKRVRERGENSGLTLVIVDAQAGCSDDLIAFLSADLGTINEEVAEQMEITTSLVAYCNPFNDLYPAAGHILKLCRLRLHLLSTVAPVHGPALSDSSPLPISCFKNMIVVNWGSVDSIGFIEESKLAKKLQSDNHSCADDDQSLATMIRPLLNKVSIYSDHYCFSLNAAYLELRSFITAIVQSVYILICEWITEQRDSLLQSFQIDGLVDLPAVNLGFLVNSAICEKLRSVEKQRYLRMLDLKICLAKEREVIVYEQTLAEVFGASLDYWRTAKLLIPPELLPPFAMSSASLLSKCMVRALSHASHTFHSEGGTRTNKFYGLPACLGNVVKSVLCIINVQRKHRALMTKKQQKPRTIARETGQSMRSRRTETSNNAKLLEQLVTRVKSEKFEQAEVELGATQISASETKKDDRHNILDSSDMPIPTQAVPVSRKDRDLAMKNMPFLVHHLREIFLKEIVDYIGSIIRPGYEWMTKFAMIVSMWSKSSAVPENELRTLSRLVSLSLGTQFTRFAVHANTSDRVLAVSTGGVDHVHKFLKSRASMFSNAALTAGSETSATVTNTATSATVTSGEEDEEGGFGFESDEVLTELVDKISLGKRLTAFRVGLSPSSTVSTVVSSNQLPLKIPESSSSVACVGLPLRANQAPLPVSGPIVDGLRIPCTKNNLVDVDSWRAIERFQSVISEYNENTRPARSLLEAALTTKKENHAGDAFEMEWLQLAGVKVFSTLASKAVLQALGASDAVIDNVSEFIAMGRAAASNFKQRPTRVSVMGGGSVSQGAQGGRLTARMSVPERLTMFSRNASNDFQISRRGSRNSSQVNMVARNRHNSRLSIRSSVSSVASSVPSYATHVPNLRSTEDRGSRGSSQGISGGGGGALNAMMMGLSGKRPSISYPPNVVTDKNSTVANAQTKRVPSGADPILSLFTTPDRSRYLLHILETHSSLSRIFGDVSEALEDKLEEFIAWKRRVMSSSSSEFVPVGEAEIEDLLDKVVPPRFSEEEDGFTYEGINAGLWVQGFELTVLQTMIFSEIISPGSAGAIANAWFSSIICYLLQGGKIMVHPDEDLDDDEDANDDVYTDTRASLDRERTDTGGALHAVREGDEDEEYDDDDDAIGNGREEGPRDEFDFHSVITEVANKKLDKEGDGHHGVSVQLDASITNCWSKLRRVISGRSAAVGAVLHERFNSKYVFTCRDYENWENVLLPVLHVSSSVDKYTFMASLRSSLSGDGGVFLCSSRSRNQMMSLSERVRSLGVHNNNAVSIINCRPTHSSVLSINSRTNIMDCQRAVRIAIATSRSHKAALESLDLSGPLGNSVLDLGLTLAGKSHAVGSADVGGAAASSPEKTSSVPSATGSKSFPLIISSEWKGPQPGAGPLADSGELTFAWLPRFMCADVTVSQRHHVEQQHRSGQYPPGLLESAGIVFEELENCLLWVMISCRMIVNANISPDMLHKLRHAKKIQVRVTSGLIALWHMVLYQYSSAKEFAGGSANWSECVVPLSLWQLARLLIKTSEIIEIGWPEAVLGPSDPPESGIDRLQKSRRFRKAVDLLSESFGFLNPLSRAALEPPKATGSTSLSSASATSGERTSTSSSRRSVLKESQQQVGNLTPGRPGSQRPSVLSASAKPPPSSSSPSPSPSPSSGLAAISPAKRAVPPGSEAKTPSTAGAVGGITTVMLHMKKKAAIAATQVVSKRLELLRSVERFSLLVPTDIAAAVASRHQRQRESIAIAVPTKTEGLEHSTPASTDSLNQSKDGVLMGFKSSIARYLAAVIVRNTKQSKISATKNPGVGDERYVLGDSSAPRKDFEGRTSMKLDIQNIMASSSLDSNPSAAKKNSSSVETRIMEDLPVVDMSVGSLGTDELIECIARWTFDAASEAPSSVKMTAAKKGRISKQLIASLRKASTQK